MWKLKVAAALIFIWFANCILATTAGNQTTAEINEIFAEVSKSEQTIKCEVEAYRRGIHGDSVPAVTNIRSQPNKNSAIVKAISTKDEVVFSITGSANGWFEISKVETVGTDEGKALFQGLGWVHASQLDLSVASSEPKLYAKPKRNSGILKRLIADESPAEPLACQGKWMKVKSGKLTGWLSPAGQCANPLTTCS